MVPLPLQPTPLFGGAMTTSLPPNFLDASQIRQIPDNQEVFLSATSTTSIIVSLLERVDAASDLDAVRVHFDDSVCSATDREGNADAARVLRVDAVPAPAGSVQHGAAHVLVAGMTTSESERRRCRERGDEEVVGTGVVMGVVRLERVRTDVVLLVSVPFVAGQFEPAEVDWEGGKLGAKMEEAVRWMEDGLLAGLEVKDWGLFGEE